MPLPFEAFLFIWSSLVFEGPGGEDKEKMEKMKRKMDLVRWLLKGSSEGLRMPVPEQAAVVKIFMFKKGRCSIRSDHHTGL